MWDLFQRLDQRGDVEIVLPPLTQQPVQLVGHKPHRREPVLDLHRWGPHYCQDSPG